MINMTPSEDRTTLKYFTPPNGQKENVMRKVMIEKNKCSTPLQP